MVPRPSPIRPTLVVPLVLVLASCVSRPPRDWTSEKFDILTSEMPAVQHKVRGVPVSDADYQALLGFGEGWFRNGAFGNERAISDVMGVFGATIDVPCAPGSLPGCTISEPVMPRLIAAIDALDRVQGNLFQGNGGPDGTGYTSDLVIEFPKGTMLYGTIPVPERLHTGLDIEAGEVWPIGIVAVPAPAADADLPWIPKPSDWGYADAPEGRYRLRLACAACHYSLDVDNDGHADLKSARRDRPTAGSAFAPEDAWGVGNQDISFGWLFSLSTNPLLGAPVLAGAVGTPGPDAAIEYMNWVLANYRTSPEAVTREVVVAMLAQPRGYADVMTDGMFNTMQLPTLYTRHAWPANSDGAQSNDTDRNNTVWTGALDFTGLIDLCGDRGSSVTLPWEPSTIFDELDCETFADLMTRGSPAAKHDPALQRVLMDDILGLSDGVPGMLDADSMVVMQTTTIPKSIVQSQPNIDAGRIRKPKDFPGDGRMRGNGMAALGMRIAIEPDLRDDLQPFVDRYEGLYLEDLMSDSVSLMLDWMDPPANNTPLLASSTALVKRGQQVFQAAGCEQCHRGPYATDNVIHPLSLDPREEFGGPRAPATAGWRVLDRGVGPAILTEPQRTLNTRNLRRLVSAPYDPADGSITRAGGVLPGLLTVQNIGYKTTPLRYLWGSAPYLHDGGIGVGLRPGSAPAGTDLAALLKRTDGVIHGMGELLTLAEPDPSAGPRPDAALSLQALVLKSEREKVVAANRQPSFAVWPGAQIRVVGDGAPPERVPMATMGVLGIGHDFYVDDVPGGEKVTALVAFLLALDDCPRDLPGGDPALACPKDATPYSPAIAQTGAR